MQSIQKVLQIIIHVLSGLIALFVLGTILFTKITRVGIAFDLSNRIILGDYVSNIVVIVGIAIFILFWIKQDYGQIDPFVSNNWKIQLLFISVILLVLQIWFTYNIYFYAGNDALILRKGAETFVNGQFDIKLNLEYYQGCPNNLMAYVIYIFTYYLADWLGVDGYILLVVFNIIISNVAVLFSALSAYKLTMNKKIMWLVYVVSVLLFGITPWLSVPYTDMMSIATPICSYYLYLCVREKNIPDIVKWLFILFVPFFMYGIKPLNIIIGIAIVICEFLCFEKTKDAMKEIGSIIIATIISFVIIFCVQNGIESYVGYEEDKEKALSIDWFLLLGSDNTTYGQWSFDSLQFISQFETKEERQEKTFQFIVDRISNMGANGYISHLMNKTHVFYNDGNFGWGTTGGIVSEIPEKNSFVSKMICNIVYPPENYGFVNNYPGYGEYFKYYAIVKQVIWLFVFSFMVIGICRPTKDKRVLILKTTWIGIFLFTMLFETHARLLISYLPVFTTLMGVGILKDRGFGIKVQRIEEKQ